MKKLAWASLLLLNGCADGSEVALRAEGEILRIGPPDVSLTLQNTGSDDACVPAFQISPFYGTFEVYGSGRNRLPPLVSSNRAIQLFHGLDVIDGLLVVPSGKSKTVLIPLENYDLAREAKLSVEFELEYTGCAELFAAQGTAKTKQLQVVIN